jgi:deoxyribodipyrimidine photolyase-related protein
MSSGSENRRQNRSRFSRALAERNSDSRGRTWVFVAYDQLTDALGPLSRIDPRKAGIVLVENRWKAARRPYHKRKLAMVLANLRHFALEQAERGVAVRHVAGDGPYSEILRPVIAELGALEVMRPAEYELRADLRPLFESGGLKEVAHEGWLTTAQQFRESQSGPPWRMDAFYRHVRRESGILMELGKPIGGKFSFDTENRLSWSGKPPAAEPPQFKPDEITREVGELIERDFAGHPGVLQLEALPATKKDAERFWKWAKKECLPLFGPYEDAMSVRFRNMFHTRISALMNLHRLTPGRILADAVELEIPFESKEGFVRQILGWREYMHRVHEETNGFRMLRGKKTRVLATPGDGGFARWSGKAWPSDDDGANGLDGGAAPSELAANEPVPPALWGERSGMHCLGEVVTGVWDEAYGHHITRLMIVSNIATLIGISPRDLTDWFWVAYADAYDWVVEPNVLGMGTYGMGDLYMTKPYISGAAYIDRMSDYCESCAFDPKKNCPITPMYWAFLERNRGKLEKNIRLAMPYRTLDKRSPAMKKEDAKTFERVRERLRTGKSLIETKSAQGNLLDDVNSRKKA